MSARHFDRDSTFIALFFAGIGLLRACSESETRRRDLNELSGEEIQKPEYPWSILPGTVTKLGQFKDAYDIDSNDWIAHFFMIRDEANIVSRKLPTIPEKLRSSYRCIHSLAQEWAPPSICKADDMTKAGFEGYFYNPFLCEAGCKLNVILWINKRNGESYIVGAPDHD